MVATLQSIENLEGKIKSLHEEINNTERALTSERKSYALSIMENKYGLHIGDRVTWNDAPWRGASTARGEIIDVDDWVNTAAPENAWAVVSYINKDGRVGKRTRSIAVEKLVRSAP